MKINQKSHPRGSRARCASSAPRRLEDLLFDVGRSHEDLRRNRLGLLVLEAHAPVVADRVGQQLAVLRERGGGEGRGELLGRLVFTLGVLVPHDNGAITAISRECIVLHVEGNAIDSVDISLIFIFLFFPVALEAKIIVLAQVVL